LLDALAVAIAANVIGFLSAAKFPLHSELFKEASAFFIIVELIGFSFSKMDDVEEEDDDEEDEDEDNEFEAIIKLLHNNFSQSVRFESIDPVNERCLLFVDANFDGELSGDFDARFLFCEHGELAGCERALRL
jgi:hypothetical protein